MKNALRLLVRSLLLAAAACGPGADAAGPASGDLAVPARAAKADAADAGVDLDAPGPIELESVVSARWAIPLSGLLDLNDPKAKAAGLRDRVTPIVLSVHVLRHPSRGLWIVDTGVTRRFAGGREPAADESPVVAALLRGIQPVTPLSEIVARAGEPLAGVLFTHMHIDHVLGLPEVPASTPLWAGPGELERAPGSATSAAEQLLLARTFASLARGHDLHTWDFASAPPLGPIRHAIDVFGDRSLFALWVPGHTQGSTAFLARTTAGPVLLTGDCSHTIWGWDHDVAPGILSQDERENAESLHALRALAAAHPTMRVVVGHETDGVGTGVEPK